MNLRGPSGLSKSSGGILSRATDWLAPNQSISDLTSGGFKGFGKNLFGSVNLGNILSGAGAGSIASNLFFDEDDDWWKKAVQDF
jgi:hypothetical protein